MNCSNCNAELNEDNRCCEGEETCKNCHEGHDNKEYKCCGGDEGCGCDCDCEK